MAIDRKKLIAGSKVHYLQFFFSPDSRKCSPIVQPPACVFGDGEKDWELTFVEQFIGSVPNLSAMQKIVDLL
ncbi:hypothetical protein V6N13_109410 [Hibiscus sabdariffa]